MLPNAVGSAANPNEHQELGRLPILSDKTWNHAIVADGILFTRNGKEAVGVELNPSESPGN